MDENQVLRRGDAPKESLWNPESNFASWEAFQAELEAAGAELPHLQTFAGTLGSGPARLAEWLETCSAFHRRVFRLYYFAYMAAQVDTGDATAKGKLSQAQGLAGQFMAATAFAEPEMLALEHRLLEWAEAGPGLRLYRHYFEDLLRQKAHRRSAEVEEILGLLSEPFAGVAQTYSDLTDLDLKFADAVDSAQRRHPVTQASLSPLGIQSPDRERRRTAWQSFCDGHAALQNTLASNYATSVRQAVLLARARGYGSVLEAALDPFHIPVEVFHNVIAACRAHLPVWHRYWDVRRRALKLEAICPYDLWAPLTPRPPRVDYAQAVEWICAALEPLGEAYLRVIRRACLEERWVDYAPTARKMQGAMAVPSFTPAQYVILSYDGTPESLSTLAHELGHALHSHLTFEAQPEIYFNYAMIVGETASNFHQAMLHAYLLKTRPGDRDLQLALVDEALANFHRYFFIMPTLARFEWEVYRRAESNEPLTAGILNDLMAGLYAEGYGATMTDDRERTALTWAQFGHLYTPFYTFQYAVGISAAHALAERVLSGDPAAAQSYLQFLRAGTSLYALDTFKVAGLDMSTPEPVEQAFGVLSGLVDRLEALAG
jgi:oligoendopeptidase F